MMTGCVILAGGRSSRMGRDKAFLPIEDTNFIEKICDTFSFFDEKIIAGGNISQSEWTLYNDEIKREWNVISDMYPDKGPIGGLQSALSICHSDALFVVPCDMPFVKETVYHLLEEELTEETDAVIVVIKEGRYHPTCGIYRKTVGKILDNQILGGNNKMMEVLQRIRVKYMYLDEFQYGLFNINTPEEYEFYINTNSM